MPNNLPASQDLPSLDLRSTTDLEDLGESMTNKRFRSILLFGPPGVGKGTQGGILGTIPGFFHLSVGDVFRSIDIGSPEGQEVCKYSSAGQLVPDELTIKIWKKALNAYIALSRYKPREDLLVLDGMPRNPAQAKLVEDHLEIQQVIDMRCSDEEDMVLRIRRRAIRENRADDANEDVIRKRFRGLSRAFATVARLFRTGNHFDRGRQRFTRGGAPAGVGQKSSRSRTLTFPTSGSNWSLQRFRDALRIAKNPQHVRTHHFANVVWRIPTVHHLLRDQRKRRDIL